MRDVFLRLRHAHFVRYFVASVGALAVDMGSFLVLLETPIHPGLAAALGYTLGIVAHWILLSRSVFEDGTCERGSARTRQKAVFLLTTWGGLALTTALVGIAVEHGIDARASKAVAVAASFLLNYFIRKNFIFNARQAIA